jgi:Protein of unknown function (DUF3106)
MRKAVTSRSSILRALLVGLFAGWSGIAFAQRHATIFRGSPSYSIVAASRNGSFAGQQERPAPVERRPPAAGAAVLPGSQQHLVGPNGRRGGEHLPEWMEQHKGMTLEQQQEALDREPGFRELPLQTQNQMHQRLAQLNAMPPEQRARILAHTEAMERLNPAQRSQVRGVMEQLGSLPQDQRRQVIHSFRELRMLPPEQRFGMMNSPRYGWLNYAQRTVLTNLIVIAPMLPSD